MGTRGFIVYRYKGSYYVKYNHWDSYPSGLGLDLVRTIPKTKEEFEAWLEKTKKFCEVLESSDSDYQESASPPENDLFIEWTYTFDLDNLCFVVDSSAFFDLEAIAKIEAEWIQFLALDSRGRRCLRLNTPPELIGKFKLSENLVLGEIPVPSADILASMVIKSPTTWSQPLSPHHRRLMLILANSVIAESYSLLSTIHQYEPDHEIFRTTATTFLASIIPNNQVLLTDRQSVSDKSSSLGGGPWFWYRGCLILLANQLDNKERFDCYIRTVVSRAKAKNLDTCVAILWSIQHVAVVEISNGLVSHSHAIPFLAAYGSDEESFLSALHLLWHYLPYPRRRHIVEERDRRSSALHNRTLPAEIILKIMACTEASDYPKYQFISRNFFEMWWSHLRLSKFTIIPDADQPGDTSHFFTAKAPDDTMPVLLKIDFEWGVGESNIWGGSKLKKVDNPDHANTYWNQYEKSLDRKRDNSCDMPSFIIYVQHFYDAWLDEGNEIPKVRDNFSSHTHDLICEVLEK